MISLEKWMILTPLQKLPNNMGDLAKIIVAFIALQHMWRLKFCNPNQ